MIVPFGRGNLACRWWMMMTKQMYRYKYCILAHGHETYDCVFSYLTLFINFRERELCQGGARLQSQQWPPVSPVRAEAGQCVRHDGGTHRGHQLDGREEGDQGQEALLPGVGLPGGGWPSSSRPLSPGHRDWGGAGHDGRQELPLPARPLLHTRDRTGAPHGAALPGGDGGGPLLHWPASQADEEGASDCSRHQQLPSLVEAVKTFKRKRWKNEYGQLTSPSRDLSLKSYGPPPTTTPNFRACHGRLRVWYFCIFAPANKVTLSSSWAGPHHNSRERKHPGESQWRSWASEPVIFLPGTEKRIVTLLDRIFTRGSAVSNLFHLIFILLSARHYYCHHFFFVTFVLFYVTTHFVNRQNADVDPVLFLTQYLQCKGTTATYFYTEGTWCMYDDSHSVEQQTCILHKFIVSKASLPRKMIKILQLQLFGIIMWNVQLLRIPLGWSRLV